MARLRELALVCQCLLFLISFNRATSLAITSITLQTSHTDNYILHGDKALLTCHYNLVPGEKLTKVEWLKDDDLVYLWRNNLPPSAIGSFQGRVDLTNKAANSINITNAHMDMAGYLTCRISTNERKTEESYKLIIIVNACGEDSFSSHFESMECSETIKMRCTGIYPKPSPMCGVYDNKKQTFIRSSPFDSVSQLDNGTFEIGFTHKYTIDEFINMTDIVFSCSITIQETNWKVKVILSMFGDHGCSQKPPEIGKGYYNLTDGRSCWGHPKDGEEAIYTCESGSVPEKTENLICRNGSWVAEKVIGDTLIVKESFWPYCGTGTMASALSLTTLLFITVANLLFQNY